MPAPWHKAMVHVAFGEGENPLKSGATSAKQWALNLLRSAPLVELKRLMRAAFIEFQKQMRHTDVAQPVPGAFLKALRTVSRT